MQPKHSHVHSSTFHNSQEKEATLISISEWMEKENEVPAKSRILFSHYKGEILSEGKVCMELELTVLSKIIQI